MIKKERYEAPGVTVVKVKTEGLVCASAPMLFWLLNGTDAECPADDWTRDGYGSANEL